MHDILCASSQFKKYSLRHLELIFWDCFFVAQVVRNEEWQNLQNKNGQTPFFSFYFFFTCNCSKTKHLNDTKSPKPNLNFIGNFHLSKSNGICSLWHTQEQQNERCFVCVRMCVDHSFASVSLHCMPGTRTICVLWLWNGCCFSPGSRSVDKDRRGIMIR